MHRFLSIAVLLVLSILCFTVFRSYRGEAHQEPNSAPFGKRERIIIKKSDFNPPVWINRTKTKKGIVQVGKRFEDDDDWLRGFTVGILNASNRTVTHVSVELLFRHGGDLRQPAAGWFLDYGANPLAYDSASKMPALTAPSVIPGGDIELRLDDNEFGELMRFLKKAGFPSEIHTLEIRINSIAFSDDTVWSSGKMLRRDPTSGKWSPISGSIGATARPRSPPRSEANQASKIAAASLFSATKFTDKLYNVSTRQDPPIECFSYVGTLPRCGFSSSGPEDCRMHDLEQTFSPPFNEKSEFFQSRLVQQHKASPKPSTLLRERLKIMSTHVSATALEETPHETETTQITISDGLRRRAQSVINDASIDPQWRNIVRYALEINDPLLPDLVRRAGAGERIIDTTDFSQTPEIVDDHSPREKLEALIDIICGAGGAKAAGALFVLMGALENSTERDALAYAAKHFAFTRCGELNLYGMVDAQIAIVEAAVVSGERAHFLRPLL